MRLSHASKSGLDVGAHKLDVQVGLLRRANDGPRLHAARLAQSLDEVECPALIGVQPRGIQFNAGLRTGGDGHFTHALLSSFTRFAAGIRTIGPRATCGAGGAGAVESWWARGDHRRQRSGTLRAGRLGARAIAAVALSGPIVRRWRHRYDGIILIRLIYKVVRLRRREDIQDQPVEYKSSGPAVLDEEEEHHAGGHYRHRLLLLRRRGFVAGVSFIVRYMLAV